MLGSVFNLIGSLIFYGISLFLLIKYRNKLPIKLMNVIFVIFIFIPYLGVVYIAYKSVGLHDWNFLNALPPANVSPFMFTLSIFTLILPKKARNVIFRVYSLLVVGMFFAAIIADCAWLAGHKQYYFFRTLDSMSHLGLSLFGIYLVLTKQVEINVKSFIKGIITMYSVVLVMIILNVICDASFFGLAFNGTHNIYNIVLTPNPYLSACLYILGLFIVLISGYFAELLITKKIVEK